MTTDSPRRELRERGLSRRGPWGAGTQWETQCSHIWSPLLPLPRTRCALGQQGLSAEVLWLGAGLPHEEEELHVGSS